jgi:phosphoenolpyruvate-protein phosphotransferase
MTRIRLKAPCAGWCLPLAEIPDAAFAEGMLGDGIGIDPLSSELCAPCDGEVISTAAARHAVALRTAEGAEILVHVGIDTVSLGGAGFELRVRKGDRVRSGDVLLRFDLDALAQQAPSVITPLIVTNGERFRVVAAHTQCRVAAGDVVLELEAKRAASGAGMVGEPASREPSVTEQLVVEHAHGIHARPAALLARAAKTLAYPLEVRARGRGADPRSAVALMSLGIRGGDEVVIAGFEPAAAAGVAKLADIIRSLAHAAPAPAPATVAAPAAARPTADPTRLAGVVASRGIAAGPAFRLQAREIAVDESGRGAAEETRALDAARERVRTVLTRRAETAGRAARELLDAHLELLDDPELLGAANRAIAEGKSAGFAWRGALRASAATLAATGDARLAERGADLEDLEHQVLGVLSGRASAAIAVPDGAVLLARDLTPSQYIELTPKPRGIALAAGGPTSHVAILAGTQGVPMVVALGPGLLETASGTVVLLDADAGTLRVAPGAAERQAFERRLTEAGERHERERAVAQDACRLASGERIEVFANLAGTVADAQLAIAQGAEGCGLLRTEFLFLDRAAPPDEAEQVRCYEQVARVLDGRPLVIRTFDVGGDKPIPYLPLPAEDNPALGLRGIRASLWRPDLCRVQLRALLAAKPAGAYRILLPMITDIGEIRGVRTLLEEIAGELGVRVPPLGAMIETPAAAMLAGRIAREVDFLSIGTNDLAQYALAMDRGHAELAARIDGLHPAVLRLIAAVAQGAGEHGKPLAVCGGLASDTAAVPLLVGLGVTELSAVPAMIPRLKSCIAALTLEGCRSLARQALDLESAPAVRALVGSGATS